MPRISAYETADGMVFKDRQLAKEHDAYLSLVELAGKMPIRSTGGTETFEDVTRQRADWLIEHRDDIRLLAKHAKNHAKSGATGPAMPEEDGAS